MWKTHATVDDDPCLQLLPFDLSSQSVLGYWECRNTPHTFIILLFKLLLSNNGKYLQWFQFSNWCSIHFLASSWISAPALPADYEFCSTWRIYFWFSSSAVFCFIENRKGIWSVVIWIRGSGTICLSSFPQSLFLWHLLVVLHRVQYNTIIVQNIMIIMLISSYSSVYNVDIQPH